jgi:hypothetical protein
MRKKLILLAIVGIAASSPAQAQDDAGPDHLAALKNCQSLAENSERLVCYDAAVGTMVAASDQGGLRIVDEEEVTQARRRLFGFSLPKIGLFKDDASGEFALDQLESTIKTTRSLSNGGHLFEIDDGGWWQINSPPRRLIAPKAGDKVVFKRASMGTYFIRINSQIGVKGRRVQ